MSTAARLFLHGEFYMQPGFTSACFSSRWFVPAVLVVSVALRVALALQGGQYFFGDEERYDRGLQLYQALAAVDPAGVRAIVALPEHALFPWISAVVTALHHVFAHFTPYGDWRHPEHIAFTISLGAGVLSIFSAINLLLFHRLASTIGASTEEAGWALLLMATSNTAFYYARHLLPYECAITAALAALCVGLRRSTVAASLGCGLLAGGAYHLYNGYWYWVPVVWLIHALAHRQRLESVRLSTACAGGIFAAISLPIAAGWAVGGERYLALMLSFSRSATQGLFVEGWLLPWEYFWYSEGIGGVVVLVCIGLALVREYRTGVPLPAYVCGALVALAAAYGLLVLFSVGLEQFVVYARTVKPLVPGLCLVGGWSLARVLEPRPRLRLVVLGGIVLAGALHFWPHFMRVFPREIEIAMLRTWGNPKHTLSVTGSLYIPLALPVTRPDLALVNCQMLYPIRDDLGYPAGETIFKINHALAYRPFQYECHTPRERAFLRTHDISVQLIKLASSTALPPDLPPAFRYRTEDRPTGY